MTAPFIGEVKPFAFNFAPRNYMFCAGQLLPIQQYTALFSILGTTYGGNGTTNFALPNLRSRVAVGNGNGAGLTPVVLGEVAGVETVTLLSTEMPSHSHAPLSKIKPGTADGHHTPVAGDYLTRLNVTSTAPGLTWHDAPLVNPTTLHPTAISLQGGNQPHNNIQPTLAVNYCIAIQGIFPSRN